MVSLVVMVHLVYLAYLVPKVILASHSLMDVMEDLVSLDYLVLMYV